MDCKELSILISRFADRGTQAQKAEASLARRSDRERRGGAKWQRRDMAWGRWSFLVLS